MFSFSIKVTLTSQINIRFPHSTFNVNITASLIRKKKNSEKSSRSGVQGKICLVWFLVLFLFPISHLK